MADIDIAELLSTRLTIAGLARMYTAETGGSLSRRPDFTVERRARGLYRVMFGRGPDYEPPKEKKPLAAKPWRVSKLEWDAYEIDLAAEGNAYWEGVKREFRVFLCTENPRYADLKKRLYAVGNKSQTAIVGMIAAAVGASLGATAGVVSPFIILCLSVVVRIGKNAYCAKWARQLKLVLDPDPAKARPAASAPKPRKVRVTPLG